MATGITSVEISNNLGASPASTHRPSGKVWINANFMGPQMRKPYWTFILDHEEAHIVLDTRSEFEADQYAATKFLNKYPKAPFDMVKALTEVLPMNTAEQKQRVAILNQRAAKFDCEHNGKCNTNMVQNNTYTAASNMPRIACPDCRSKPIANIFSEPNGNQIFGLRLPSSKISSFNPDMMAPSGYHVDGWGGLSTIGPGNPSRFDPDYEYSNFTNCSKYIIPKRRKNCEAENQRERDAQFKLALLTNQGTANVGAQQASVAGSLGNLLAGDITPPPAEPAKSNTMIIVVILLGAAISIGAVLYFMGKKPA